MPVFYFGLNMNYLSFFQSQGFIKVIKYDDKLNLSYIWRYSSFAVNLNCGVVELIKHVSMI